MPDEQLIPAPDRPVRRFNAGFVAAGMVYNQAVTVLSGVLIGRIVGAADYGIANIAKNLFQIAAIVTPMGLDLALQRDLASGRAADPHRRAVLKVLRGLAFAVALLPAIALALGLGGWLEAHVYRYPAFGWVLLATFVALPFATDAAVTGGAYRGMRQPGASILATYVLQPTVRVVLVSVLFLLGWRLWAIIVATTAAAILSWAYVFFRARRDFPTGRAAFAGAWGSARGVLGYSWVMGASLVITMVTKSVDVLMLGHFRPSVEVGRYVAVQLLVGLLTVFSGALGQTLGAAVADRFEADDLPGVERLLTDNIRAISLVSAPLYAVILLWGDRIDLVLGKSFTVDYVVVSLLATMQLMIAAFNFSGLGLSMTGRQATEAGILAIGLGLTIILCSLLVPAYGPRGAALATLVSIGSVNALRVLVVRRVLGIHIFRWRALAPLVLALAAGVAIRTAAAPIDSRSLLSTAASALLAMAVYALAGWWLLLDSAERTKARAVVARRSARAGNPK